MCFLEFIQDSAKSGTERNSTASRREFQKLLRCSESLPSVAPILRKRKKRRKEKLEISCVDHRHYYIGINYRSVFLSAENKSVRHQVVNQTGITLGIGMNCG